MEEESQTTQRAEGPAAATPPPPPPPSPPPPSAGAKRPHPTPLRPVQPSGDADPPPQAVSGESPAVAASRPGHFHRRRALGFTATPLGFALFAAWLLVLFAAVSFDVVVDVFQAQIALRQPPVVPASLLLSANAGFHVFLVAMAMLLGRLTRRRFRFFQPFVGGDAFVFLQLVGYLLVSVSAAVRAVLLAQKGERYGAYSVLGVFAALGHCLLLWSISFFQSPSAAATAEAQRTATTAPRCKRGSGDEASSTSGAPSKVLAWRARLSCSPQREIAWIVLCCVLVSISAAMAEYHPAYRGVNVVVVLAFLAASLLTIQYVVVPLWLEGEFYHVFLPVVLQSPSMYVLQLFGNGLVLASLYAEWILVTDTQTAPASSQLGCGLMAVMAVGAHLLLVHQLHMWQCECAERESAAARADAEDCEVSLHTTAAAAASAGQLPSWLPPAAKPTSFAEAASHQRVRSASHTQQVGSVGPVMSSLFSVLLCVTLILILYVSSAPQYHLSAYAREGLAQLEALLLVLMFVQPLITHFMGVFIYGKVYRIWQPFEGNVDYILLQSVGWCCYGLAIFFATLHLSERGHINFLLLLMAVLVLSQFFVHMSVARFGRKEPPAAAAAATAAASAATARAAAAAAGDDDGSEGSPSRSTQIPGDETDRAAATPLMSGSFLTSASDDTLAASTASASLHHDGSGGSALLASVVTGELLLAAVLMGVSMVLRVVVSAALYMRQLGETGHTVLASEQFPVAALVGVATLFSIVATPTLLWSMRHCVRLLHPRSHAYVAVATLGWGTYLLLLSHFLVMWGLQGMEEVAAMSPTARLGLSCFLPSSEPLLSALPSSPPSMAAASTEVSLAAALECAVEGFVWCFPFLCLMAGNLFESQAVLRAASIEARVRGAMTAVTELFERQRTASTGAHAALPAAEAKQLKTLLRTIAGSRLSGAAHAVGGSGNGGSRENGSSAGGTPGLDRGDDGAADPADVQAMHDAARYVTSVLCAGTFAAFSSAAFLAKAQPILTLGFGAVGMATLGLSCFALHYVYGTRVHSAVRPVSDAEGAPCVPVYTFFMPFRGGRPFVIYQVLGWIAFTCVGSLMAACAVEGRGAPTMFLTMAVLSVAAQVALCRAVPLFDETQVFSRGFVQRNTEGLLAAIAVAATVSFCRVYDMAVHGRATSHVVSSLVPVVICSVSVCTAIPLGLVSLQRQAELYGLGSVADWFADDDDGDSDQADLEASVDEADDAADRRSSGAGAASAAPTPQLPHSIYSRTNTESTFSPLLGTPGIVRRRFPAATTRRAAAAAAASRRRSFGAVLSFLLASVMAILVVTVLPFAVLFMGYAYYTQRATAAYDLALRAVEVLLCFFMALVLLPMVVVPVVGRSSTLRNVHSAFCCYALYSIPTYIVVGGVSAPFIYDCRGTWLFAINMCSMSCLSTLPYMPVAMLLFSVGATVSFLQHHFYDGLYRHKHPFHPAHCVIDLAFAAFWLWYQQRYRGRPEVTGRLQSWTASRFFQRYFFRGLSYYFSMRVIVGEGYVLPEEEPYVADAAALPRVDLSKPGSQYMFSFHPHGVFPGTSIVVPKTEIWEKAVGRSTTHFVSTHCADIVFAVPLMREFPLCLGAMSVGRRGIESSLKQGNSPLIITGGQAEMLLTKMSDVEMHVVCHHIGFVRMAMKNRVPLVPVISFSESNILDNVHCIRVQRWFLNRIAFPFPVLPMGRWHLPLPTAKPVTIVVGQPLLPLPGRENPEDPACVEEMRRRYFEHLEVLFYKYRAEAGYPQMELYLHNGIYNAGVRGSASTSVPVDGKRRTDTSAGELSIEVLESAVRRAFAAAPQEAHGKKKAADAVAHEKKRA